MRVVGLISGGKDSCYNLMQCVAEGHELVALANLRPCDKDELDSYMYQTVGHHAIDLYAEAIGLPLYRRTISGTALDTNRDYVQTSDDEVEDLFLLLQQIKMRPSTLLLDVNIVDNGIEFDAVSVGAILSDYQRVRVENVCSRLGLTSLAYLWRRDQKELLAEMINAGVKAILIKVATLGLTPEKHLGKSLEEIHDHMLLMSERFGLNVCGEGGEYETFTLDCPLFLKRIVLDEVDVIMHSDDAFAPVAYLNLRQMHLVDKNIVQLSMRDRLSDITMKRANDLHCELFPDGLDPVVPVDGSGVEMVDPCDQSADKTNHIWSLTEPVVSCRNSSGLLWVTGVLATGHSTEDIQRALDSLTGSLSAVSCHLTDVVAVYMFVSDMSKFSTINNVYKNYFPTLPPVRVCVEACLPSGILFQLDCIAFRPQEDSSRSSSSSSDRIELRRMHVQSLSFWAPANIGPYSQAVQVRHRLYVAGQIALCPSTMALVGGGPIVESRLALRHVSRVLDAVCSGVRLCDVINAVCYVTSREAGLAARHEWNRALVETSDNDNDAIDHGHQPLVQYVIVPALPRQAAVEWQVTAGSHPQVKDWIVESFQQSNSEFTIQCEFCRASDQKDLLSFLVSVDAHPGTDSSSNSPSAAVCSALSALGVSVSGTGSSLSDIGALRVFVSMHRFVSADVYQDCQSAAKSVFGDDVMLPFTVIPVCRFLSPLTVLTVCQA